MAFLLGATGRGGGWEAAARLEVRGSRMALPDDLAFRAAGFEPEAPAEVFAGTESGCTTVDVACVSVAAARVETCDVR